MLAAEHTQGNRDHRDLLFMALLPLGCMVGGALLDIPSSYRSVIQGLLSSWLPLATPQPFPTGCLLYPPMPFAPLQAIPWNPTPGTSRAHLQPAGKAWLTRLK
jgi:hypothetical protein